ncbi:site-2 protease family protein [Dactylosporangium sp. AC04546]|uniref:YlbL family protein n=1 Tax=Dactylosporangium sp. AC04546 TaxID=2862460 RepID=UPI001EDCCB61|nr:PDZ domain-containing protein [Dactylosporangium sp. AC04546]WVK84852.1 site-2 protease family protein [Dactylosporangium sp. AC04546]
MRRRGLTVLFGALLLLVLSWQATVVKVPYVEMGPGPTYNTLGTDTGKPDGKPIINVSGVPVTKSAGELRMTTVSVQPDLTLLDAMIGWFKDDRAVVPRELIYPPDRTEQQVQDDNARDFQESQTSAETVALKELGYPVQVTVGEVTEGYPAAGQLQKDDVITAIDGTAVTSVNKLTELVRAKPADVPRQVEFKRGTETKTVSLTTKKGDDGNPRLGVVVAAKQPHPFELSIQLDKIGGPSAGLMFTLGIIDTIKPEDLTGGYIIAGTGTIDEEGNVGPIGGIPQKLVAAKAAKAKFFLTPAANCAEAMDNPQSGLPLVKVTTLDDALTALEQVRAGRTPALCS